MNTPTITAYKFWPGAMGLMANHAIIYARCISKGKDHGPKPFFVQIRDLENHKPCQGIEVGDLGPKMGFNGTDNGFLAFSKYRIPRNALLGRFWDIDSNGDGVVHGDPRMLYNVMLQTRMSIMGNSTHNLKRCLVIATRYAVCRRQFSTIPGQKLERKLLDYQTHLQTLGS
jgi:acyl-CoA oxidase